MVLEVVNLNIRAESREMFEVAFPKAARILAGARGYISHQLQRSVDNPNRYVLLVQWQTVEDHVVGFRGCAISGLAQGAASFFERGSHGGALPIDLVS